MAVPTLTPSSATSAITLSSGSLPSEVSGLPFGVYSTDRYFLSGASDQVAYTYKKLGGDVLDIEITKEQVYTSYEEAVLEYSYILNIHQSKNVLSNVLGQSTGSFDHDGQIKSGEPLSGSNINLKFPRFELTYAKKVASGMASEAGIGGDRTIYSASFDTETDRQDYDLQTVISASSTDSSTPFYDKVGNKRINITRVYYKTPHAMWRFYGYYGGLNTVGNLSNYGQYADDSTFEIIPAWQNKLQAMAFEDAIWTRNSHYSYEIRNNKIKIYPTPVSSSPSKLWVEFFVQEDAWSDPKDRQGGADGINNINTLPFENVPYQNINAIGKQWIRRFALSLSKEMLGYIRNKFTTIPIPGESVTLNGSELITQAQAEQDKLREELKGVLDELTYAKLAERDAVTVGNVNKAQERLTYPSPVVVG